MRRGEDGRYRMLQTIREYAGERLDEKVEARDARLRHAEYFCELGDELGAELGGDGVEDAYATFEREHDNFRAALAFTGEPELAQRRKRRSKATQRHNETRREEGSWSSGYWGR